jgi:L-glyceraldehyde 3-phosphate reductase
MFNRWIEDGLLDVLGEEGVGTIVFSPLAQGLLSERYLEGIPEDSRAARNETLPTSRVNEEMRAKIKGLAEIAARRGQTLPQLALAWTLRDPRVTSTLVGVSSLDQLEQNVATLAHMDFSEDELEEIDRFATE